MMGASDPFSRGKTATQHTSEVDEGSVRLTGPIFNWEIDVGEPMLHQMVWNNQQFMSYERVVREVGAFGLQYVDRYTIRPEDLIGRFLVNMLAGSRWTMKQQQVQQLINLLDRAPVVNQMYGPQAIKMIPLWATILEHGFDIRNVEDFVTLPPEEAGLHIIKQPRKPSWLLGFHARFAVHTPPESWREYLFWSIDAVKT